MRTRWTSKENRDAGSSCSCDRGLRRYLRNFGGGGGLNTPNPPFRYATERHRSLVGDIIGEKLRCSVKDLSYRQSVHRISNMYCPGVELRTERWQWVNLVETWHVRNIPLSPTVGSIVTGLLNCHYSRGRKSNHRLLSTCLATPLL